MPKTTVPAGVLAMLATVACADTGYDGYVPSPSYNSSPTNYGTTSYSTPPSSSSSKPDPRSSTYVRRDGTVVVVDRYADGTKTYADSRGNYGVKAPYYDSGSRSRRR
ncbi:MAG: hypothetical protein Q8N31_16620 [Reyranella sp.]|nr:hypothetical protein [Reyranella sp.]MDP3161640.1 hypothetical protein [Reyranella sp.]